MRRHVAGTALATLLVLLTAAPAGAVAPSDALIAASLRRAGLIPSYADGPMTAAAVQALAVTPPRHELKSPLVQRAARDGTTPLARHLHSRSSARGTAGEYVAHVLVLLVEFGDAAWPAGSPRATGPMTPGPRHGQIPPPAPGDEISFWPGDFTRAHYRQQLFGDSFPIYDASGAARGSSDVTMRTWFLEQSHGSFTVGGDVTDWVRLEMPESWYGADAEPWVAEDDLTGPVWRVARDAVATFAAEHPGFRWAEYDRENPYGIAGDGFARPDGYVDHLVIVHAGADQAAGGGAQGPDAIWSHSWTVQDSLEGGPGGNPGYLIPGTEGQGPGRAGIWVGPYTIDSEDSPPGVFCHEFAHDLGLPDEYDVVSAEGDGSGFWTAMAQGEWLGRRWGLGSDPGPLNVWDKSTLGFVSPVVVRRGTTRTVSLRPAAGAPASATGLVVELPRLRHVVALSGRDGAAEWYSGSGNERDARLTAKRPLSVPSGGRAVLTMHTWYEIEDGYDFGFVRVSSDGGATWTTARSAGLTREVRPGVHALSGTRTANWRSPVAYDLRPWAGKKVLLEFRYLTDEGVALRGWEVTDVVLGGTRLPVSDFTRHGWTRVDGRAVRRSEASYFAEYRTHDGADGSLADVHEPDWQHPGRVDWYAYGQGLHLIYRDTFWADNDVGAHPGEGGWLVVDARPQPDAVRHGDAVGYWRTRIQLRDAAFGLAPTRAQTIFFRDYGVDPVADVGRWIAPGEAPAPLFDDARAYWYPQTPLSGVKLPGGLGVRLRVTSATPDALTVWVDNVR